MKLRTFSIMIVLCGSMALAANAPAQEYQQAQPGSPDEIQVSDSELEKFVDAQQEIVQIQQDFSGRLQGVEDPDEAHQLQVQANEEMTAAVRDAGLDVESFNQIAVAVQNDAELQQRLSQIMEQ